MALRHRERLVLLAAGAAVALVGGSCKVKQPPPAKVDPVTAAIELRGGLKRLKAASSFSAGYQAESKHLKIKKGKLKQKGGAMWVEYVIPYGDRVILGTGPDACWRKRGEVVIPCDGEHKTHASRLARLYDASWIWPLAQRKDLKVTTNKVQHDGKTYDGLTITEAGKELGMLLLDEATALVRGLKMQTTLDGKSGEYVVMFDKFEKRCGTEVAAKRIHTFAGEPYLSESFVGPICEEIEDKVFARPEQVKDGLVKLKHKGTSHLACTKLKGKLTGVDEALGKVAAYMDRHKLKPIGAPQLIHGKGPVKVCHEVSKKAWVLPKGTWKGAFFLEEVAGDEVLAAFGVGDHVSAAKKLPKALKAGAKERKRKQWGTKRVQLLYLHREDIPAEQRVSEMHVTLE